MTALTHAASHNSPMTHIAIVPTDKNGTIWMLPVTDNEYNRIEMEKSTHQVKISLTENAMKNHKELWPDYESKAAATDPELIEVFDNFAFDDVISTHAMDVKDRLMIVIAATIGSQALTEYKMMVAAALNVGVTPVTIKEVVYQAVPYVGIAKVIDFIYATNELFTEREIKLPLAGQSTTNRETRLSVGLAKQKEVVWNNTVDEMYKNSPGDLIHMQQFLSANCFGDYITRNGLDIKQRELVTLSFLMALGGTESQIKGHIRGNANVGNDRQILINLMTQLLPYVGYPRTLNAVNCLNEILPPEK
jgi:4-carboxymuconolactone decarboxylase